MTFAGRCSTLPIVVALVAILASGARAQGTIPTDTAAPAGPIAEADTAKRITFIANLGLAIVSGNTNLTTITADDEFRWKTGKWRFQQVFALIYGKSDRGETANQVGFGLRADRSIAKRWALYLGARYDRNPFAGYDSRYSENLGVVWNALVARRDKLDLEAGVGLTQQQDTSGVHHDYPNGRLAAIYRHTWKPKTYFQESVEALPDLQDSQNLRVNSLMELIAPLSGSIAMRISYLVQYDRQPSDSSIKTTDQVLTAGLQFSF